MPKSDALIRIRPTVIIGDATVFQLVAELSKCLYRTANIAIHAYRTSLPPFKRWSVNCYDLQTSADHNLHSASVRYHRLIKNHVQAQIMRVNAI